MKIRNALVIAAAGFLFLVGAVVRADLRIQEEISATPGPSPKPRCADDVELLLTTPPGGMPFASPPLEVVEQFLNSVELTLRPPFGGRRTVSYVYVEYVGEDNVQACTGYQSFDDAAEAGVFRARCMERLPVTIVNVYVVDSSVESSGRRASLPSWCQHPAEDAGLPSVEYTFQVSCRTRCETEGPIL